MTTSTDSRIDFDSLRLDKGSHESPARGMCLMEAVAYFRGIPHTDRPPCVSPSIAAFGRAWNDTLDDDGRQILKPYVFKVVGTATSAADEERRAWLATDWLVRVFAPAWLDLAGLGEYGNALREMPELINDELATQVQPIISAADSAARSEIGRAHV